MGSDGLGGHLRWAVVFPQDVGDARAKILVAEQLIAAHNLQHQVLDATSFTQRIREELLHFPDLDLAFGPF